MSHLNVENLLFSSDEYLSFLIIKIHLNIVLSCTMKGIFFHRLHYKVRVEGF